MDVMEIDLKNVDLEDEYEVNRITDCLVENGYAFNSAMYIINLLKNGIEYALQIKPWVNARTLKEFNDVIKQFYNVDRSSEQSIVCAMIDALNINVEKERLFDRKHSEKYIKQITNDYEMGNDPSVYFMPTEISQANDFSDTKINFLVSLRDNDIKVTDEFKVKFWDLNLSSSEHGELCTYIIKSKNFDIIDELESGVSLDSARIYLRIKEISDEVYDACHEKHANFRQLEEICECLEKDIEKTKFLIDLLLSLDSSETRTLGKILRLNENITIKELNDILSLELDNDTKFYLIDLKYAYNFDISTLMKLKNINFSKRGLEKIADAVKEVDDKLIDYINIELENNKNAEPDDIIEIIKGYNAEIDIDTYITKPEAYAFCSADKEFVRELLEYNKRNPEKAVDIEDYVDFDDASIYSSILDDQDIAISALKHNFDIKKIEDSPSEYIDEIINALEDKYNPITIEQAEQLIDYFEFADDSSPMATLIEIVKGNFKILNREEIYQESFSIYKEIEELKNYDDVCKNAIDNDLRDDNCEKIINLLKKYKDARPEVKEILKISIERKFYKDVDDTMSDAQLKEILYAAQNGIFGKKYLSKEFHPRQMHILADLELSVEDSYFVRDNIFRMSKPEFNIEKLNFLAEYIKSNQKYLDSKIINPEFSMDKMDLLIKLSEKKYVYDFELIAKYENLNSKLVKKIEELFNFVLQSNNDDIETKRIFCQKEEKKFLQELSEEDITMEQKVMLFKLIGKLEDKTEDKVLENSKNNIEK